MEVFDDHRFAGFCRKRGRVPEKYLSFYIRWIKRFLLLEGERRREENDEDRLLVFIEHLRTLLLERIFNDRAYSGRIK
jgi:hypothetical protein